MSDREGFVYIAQGLGRSSNTVGSSIPRANSLINWQCTLGENTRVVCLFVFLPIQQGLKLLTIKRKKPSEG